MQLNLDQKCSTEGLNVQPLISHLCTAHSSASSVVSHSAFMWVIGETHRMNCSCCFSTRLERQGCFGHRNTICSSVLTDGNIFESLVCLVDVCFPWFSFCSPYSVRVLAVLGVPCGLSEQSILGGGKQADVLTLRSMSLISE